MVAIHSEQHSEDLEPLLAGVSSVWSFKTSFSKRIQKSVCGKSPHRSPFGKQTLRKSGKNQIAVYKLSDLSHVKTAHLSAIWCLCLVLNPSHCRKGRTSTNFSRQTVEISKGPGTRNPCCDADRLVQILGVDSGSSRPASITLLSIS